MNRGDNFPLSACKGLGLREEKRRRIEKRESGEDRTVQESEGRVLGSLVHASFKQARRNYEKESSTVRREGGESDGKEAGRGMHLPF